MFTSEYDIKETYIGPGVDAEHNGYHDDTRPNGHHPVYTRSQSYTQLTPDHDTGTTQVITTKIVGYYKFCWLW